MNGVNQSIIKTAIEIATQNQFQESTISSPTIYMNLENTTSMKITTTIIGQNLKEVKEMAEFATTQLACVGYDLDRVRFYNKYLLFGPVICKMKHSKK